MAAKIILTADYIWLQGPGPLKNRALLLDENGRVEEINPAVALAGRYRQIKQEGMILPGFVDCHVHVGLKNPDANGLAGLRKAGIMAIRDAGDRDGHALTAAQKRKRNAPPYIVPAGKAISWQGGYGGFLGKSIASRQEGLHVIEELVKQGARTIKLMVTGAMVFQGGVSVSGPYMPREDISFLTKAAHSKGLKVMAHVNTDAAIRDAVHGGVDSIEHGYFISDATLTILASQGIAWVPTLSPLYDLWEKEKDARVKAIIKGVLTGQQAALKRGVDKKVLVGLGTDYVPGGNPLALHYHREMELYRMAGLNWQEILRITAFNGYQILGLESCLQPPLDINLLINGPNRGEDLAARGISLVADILHA